MSRRFAAAVLAIAVGLFVAAGASGVRLQEGAFSWEVQP